MKMIITIFYLHLQVVACTDIYNDDEKDCGPLSEPIIRNTSHGAPGYIGDLSVDCLQNAETGENSILIRWEPPKEPDSVVDNYKLELNGQAKFIDEKGQQRLNREEERKEFAVATDRNFTFLNALPNTNYSVKVLTINFLFH